jgi:hydroxyethylthiazole kinase-like uncharacterized protein yjeF
MSTPNPHLEIFEKKLAEELFPKQSSSDIHKGHRGHLWVFASSPGYWGSGIMAARASVRCGAGYTTLINTHAETLSISIQYPELLTALCEEPTQFWAKHKTPTAILVGPGFGVNEHLKQLILFLKKEALQIPVLLDADALTVLSQMSECENEYILPSQWILTPHEGEMARLINKTSKEVHEQRSQSLLKAQEKFGCTVLLKGSGTRITDSTKKIFKINAGNPTLAKAGTGDVLAGMIGGLLAQGFTSLDACLLGAYWHADLSDWYLKTKGPEFSLRASEVSDLLPQYWKESFKF